MTGSNVSQTGDSRRGSEVRCLPLGSVAALWTDFRGASKGKFNEEDSEAWRSLAALLSTS